MVYKQQGSANWWYKFSWQGVLIRKSTGQTNKRVAEQMQAAARTALAKGEVGLFAKKIVPTLADFGNADFLPFVRAQFAAKPKTLAYYENGVNNILAFAPLANARLNALTSNHVGEYIAQRQKAKGRSGHTLQLTSLNRELQVLRRMFHLAEEWGKVEKALPKVRMVPGEKRRERVLSTAEENAYLAAAEPLLHDVATVLLECALRPEECFRLRLEHVTADALLVPHGKTTNARRRVPLTARAAAVVDMRRARALADGSPWLFGAATASGHIESSSLRKQHRAALAQAKIGEAKVQPFDLYTLRHTCLTRWAPHMDPYTLGYLAGHRDMNTTRRYVHPQEQTVRAALEKAASAKTGHSSGHSSEIAVSQPTQENRTN